MKGIRVELPPNVITNETCLNIPEEEGHKSNGVKHVGLGMLLFKLSFLEFWLLTMRILFGQPLLFFYDKYGSSVCFDRKLSTKIVIYILYSLSNELSNKSFVI